MRLAKRKEERGRRRSDFGRIFMSTVSMRLIVHDVIAHYCVY